MAMRVPVIDGSIVDLVATFEKPVTVEAINADPVPEPLSPNLVGIHELQHALQIRSEYQ